MKNNKKSNFKKYDLEIMNENLKIIDLSKFPDAKDKDAIILYNTDVNNSILKRKKIRNYLLGIIFFILLIILVIIMFIIIFAKK